ncbi:hypothetical protein [Bradyrhizobium sp.]|uniref:hypothetical protein n=1 Tax=Bradyrhizobium sp. TaxID=376 RepID=UPI003C75DB1C
MTNANLDLAELARSAGVPRARNVTTPEAFASAMGDAEGAGARVLVLSAKPDTEVVRPLIAFDPVRTKHRFMSAIGAPRYIPTMFGGGRLQHD